MTQKQLMDSVMAGGVFCAGQYVSGKADTVSIRDKTTKDRREAVVVRETLMTDTEPVIVSSWLPDGAKAADWKQVFKKGQRVVLKVNTMEKQAGIPVMGGVLESLE